MSDNKDNKAVTLEIIGLLFILALAYYLIFIPHLDYPYPLHHDEWMHMAYAKTIMQTGSILTPDPFTGNFELALGNNPETGYHVLWGIFQSITGIPWSKILLYFPGIIFMMTVSSVYILARREGYGLAAAFFTCLIPTFRGTLGPAFMVPMALGLLFIPLSLFLAFNYRTWQSYLLLFIFACLVIVLHLPTAVILFIILIPYMLLNLKSSPKHSTGIFLAFAIPFAVSIPWIPETLSLVGGLSSILQGLDPDVTLPPLLQMYGYLPLAISLIGIIWLAFRGNRRDFALLFGLLAVVLVLVVFYRFHIGLPLLYARGLTSMLLMISIVAGAGLLWIQNLRLPHTRTGGVWPFLCNNIGNVMCIPLIGVILFFSLNSHYDAYYYRMIDQEDYRAFTWMRDNVDGDSSKTLLDPWKATAYTAVTGNTVTSRIFKHAGYADEKIYDFLEHGCSDTGFLRDNKTGIIYSQSECNNTELALVRKGVYLTSPFLSWPAGRPESLRNGGFEDLVVEEYPEWWITFKQNTLPHFLYPEEGRNGGTSVGIRMIELEPFEPWPFAAWIQDVPVEAGKPYIIGGWIRTENIAGPGGAMILTHWKNSENEIIDATEYITNVKNTSDWTYYQYRVIAPHGADRCTLLCTIAGCSGTAWFDDMVFQRDITGSGQ